MGIESDQRRESISCLGDGTCIQIGYDDGLELHPFGFVHGHYPDGIPVDGHFNRIGRSVGDVIFDGADDIRYGDQRIPVLRGQCGDDRLYDVAVHPVAVETEEFSEQVGDSAFLLHQFRSLIEDVFRNRCFAFPDRSHESCVVPLMCQYGNYAPEVILVVNISEPCEGHLSFYGGHHFDITLKIGRDVLISEFPHDRTAVLVLGTQDGDIAVSHGARILVLAVHCISSRRDVVPDAFENLIRFLVLQIDRNVSYMSVLVDIVVGSLDIDYLVIGHTVAVAGMYPQDTECFFHDDLRGTVVLIERQFFRFDIEIDPCIILVQERLESFGPVLELRDVLDRDISESVDSLFEIAHCTEIRLLHDHE